MEIAYRAKLPNTPRPICIIGAGGIVNDAHLPAYRMAGFEVAGIWNRNRDRAETLATRFGIPKVFSTVPEMVAAAPANAVYDIAITAPQFAETLEQLPNGAAVLIQ
jgi:predicted dehydrogenase